jgi:hypothetical protein
MAYGVNDRLYGTSNQNNSIADTSTMMARLLGRCLLLLLVAVAVVVVVVAGYR